MRLRILIKGVNGISLEGRSVIVAICVGQLGSLLPHVVVPSILAAFLLGFLALFWWRREAPQP
jgi:hypothetical protein